MSSLLVFRTHVLDMQKVCETSFRRSERFNHHQAPISTHQMSYSIDLNLAKKNSPRQGLEPRSSTSSSACCRRRAELPHRVSAYTKHVRKGTDTNMLPLHHLGPFDSVIRLCSDYIVSASYGDLSSCCRMGEMLGASGGPPCLLQVWSYTFPLSCLVMLVHNTTTLRTPVHAFPCSNVLANPSFGR